MTDITRLMRNAAQGDLVSGEQLLPIVYSELRRLAAARMAAEKPGQTLEATALVHEVYLRLMGDNKSPHWKGQSHFFGAAAEAMRRILVENARKKKSEKHGGKLLRHTLADPEVAQDDDELLALDAALQKLAREDEKAARVVEMRYFAGMGHEEIASALSITVYRARQKWTYARAWLRREMTK